MLPGFRISRSYDWWYSGWELITARDSVWAGGHLAIAVGLALRGYWLAGRSGPACVACAPALASTMALSGLSLFALAAADALNDRGRIFRLDWHVGLALRLPGHGVMISAACCGLDLLLRRAG